MTSERHPINFSRASLRSAESLAFWHGQSPTALIKPIFLKLFRDVNKEIGLNHTQLDLKDIYRGFQNIILGIRRASEREGRLKKEFSV